MKRPAKLRQFVLTAMFFLGLSGYLSAQEKIKFGKIDIEDLKMTRCPFDSAADAMILSDVGSYRYEYSDNKGFELLFERLLRIKIFTKNGFNEGNVEIEYWYSGSDYEKVESLKGRTYNLESGKIVETKLGDESVFDEVQDIHNKLKKVSFPAIREGSVIELKYTIRSPFIGNITDWYFQGDLPIRWSEYEVNIPEYYRFGKRATGYYPFVVNKVSSHPESINFQQTKYSGNGLGLDVHATTEHSSIDYEVYTELYATQNVPALKDEPFANSLQNYSTKIRYELQSYKYPGGAIHEMTSSWDVIVKDLETDDDFGKQIRRSGLVKNIVNEVNSKAQKPFDKMVEAHTYIKTHFKWNGRNSLYPTDDLKKAFDDHAGNSADINLSLILLLRELGLDAVPVVLSTWNHGIILESMPTQRGLNYVIGLVRIDSVEYLLDATSSSLPYTMIPRRCLNGKGIVVSSGNIRWVPLLGSERDNDLLLANLKIDSIGAIQGRLEASKSGYSAVRSRENYFSSGEEENSKLLKQKFKSWDIDKITYENMDKLDQIMKIIYSLGSTDICQVNGDMIYMNVLAGMGQNSNPFNAEKRVYPVDFNCPLKDAYVFTYEIPAGYKIESLPEPVKFALPEQSASFKFVTAAKDNKIMVSSTLSITKTVFIISEYEFLRDFFARIVAKHAQQIVLKKL
ncbi:MAG: DUF3857 domain-containing protein [Bacteroidetes bacterium]|nr:DUF3857 domain-containing protein [Bacteroidota bacterium]